MSSPYIPTNFSGVPHEIPFDWNFWFSFTGNQYPNKPGYSRSKGTWLLDDKLSTKSGSKGPKVKHSWGYWSPCRPYTRSVAKVDYTGAFETYKIPGGSQIQQFEGRPYVYPTRPLNFMFTNAAVDVFGVPNLVDGNTRNRLITECINKVADRKMELGNFLATGGKTASEIAHTLLRVLQAYRAARTGNARALGKALGLGTLSLSGTSKDAAKLWLEHRYGWLPLLSDLYDLSGVLKKGLGDKAPILHATRNLSDRYPWNPIGNQGYADMSGMMLVNNRCKLWYVLDDITLFRLSQLELVNPLEIAWELLPYSFVIDWVLPIGNVLAAWTGTWGLSFLDGCITSRAEGYAGGFHKHGMSGWDFSGIPSFWSIDQFGMRRENLNYAVPGLYVKSPFSWIHAANALALLRNLARR
ncbi:maturation protein [ssRNA phage Gephyllon.4_22]|uniref:Maturation protein n=2 Tax=Fiersviridae TaxID=2842319 RepID=A0A8S5L150_9VIRU|nr:maturation protein [ssRNA phage Gephyllon.4_22]QDH89434.1 MAG: hypothetical protein H4BulkLitter24509_000003 [Leviviridae sp.]DAD51312.1 TPA_asm: maturation protein [ssRNA phage Gephyllon.4_22]